MQWNGSGQTGRSDRCLDLVFTPNKPRRGNSELAFNGVLIEIISPSSVRRDRYDKKQLYAHFGVKEYWIGDPANKSKSSRSKSASMSSTARLRSRANLLHWSLRDWSLMCRRFSSCLEVEGQLPRAWCKSLTFSKPEVRNPKPERNPNEIATAAILRFPFGFLSGFGFRTSDLAGG